MCYHVSAKTDVLKLMKRFNANPYEGIESFEAERMVYHHAKGFDRPVLPVITDTDPETIQLFQWGIVRGPDDIKKIPGWNLNTRNDTALKQPSKLRHRALVLADGFFEFKHEDEGKNKIPYFLQLANGQPFAFGAVWNTWEEPGTGKEWRTFSIMTVDGNDLVNQIHHTKRMPLILTPERERVWLRPDLTTEQLEALLVPNAEDEMVAWPISQHWFKKGVENNIPEVSLPVG
jgi:putative SOS response-associated peptidase YedK